MSPGISAQAAVLRPPTFTEMAYQSNGEGLNLALKESTNQQWELGNKWQQDNWRSSLALFLVESENELVVDQSSGAEPVIAMPVKLNVPVLNCRPYGLPLHPGNINGRSLSSMHVLPKVLWMASYCLE